MLVYAPGWTLPSQFRSYTAPPKSWFFRGQKNAIFRQHIHIEKCCFCLLVSAQKIQAPKKKCFFFLGRIFGENIICHADSKNSEKDFTFARGTKYSRLTVGSASGREDENVKEWSPLKYPSRRTLMLTLCPITD